MRKNKYSLNCLWGWIKYGVTGGPTPSLIFWQCVSYQSKIEAQVKLLFGGVGQINTRKLPLL